MPNAYPALQGELLINPLPSSSPIYLFRSIPVGEIIIGATSATPNADVKPLPANASQLKSVMEQERQRGAGIRFPVGAGNDGGAVITITLI